MLQSYLLVPSPDKRASVEDLLNGADRKAVALSGHAWIRNKDTIGARIRSLREQLETLANEARRVMAIRTDPEQLYPSMPLMLGRMLPTYNTVYAAATLAMEEAETEHNDPRQVEIHQLFAEARHSWAMMVNAFRVWVANRFGIFGVEPEAGMRAQAHNLALYSERLDAQLKRLAVLEQQDRLGLQQKQSLASMRAGYRTWLDDYRRVAAIYTSERWRSDVPIVRDSVLPLFTRLWETVRTIEADLDAFSAEDMSVLVRASDSVSGSMWLLVIIGAVITAIGSLLFEYTLLRPIARVASALKAEAHGEGGVALPTARTHETRDLIEAFAHMRQQVNSRQLRLATILDNAAEGIITFGEDGSIEEFNQAAERLFGYSEAETVGRNIGLLLVPGDGTDPTEYARRFLSHDLPALVGHEGEVTGRHRDGAIFPLALKVSAMTLDGRKLYTALVADISERKAMMDHLKKMAEHDGLTGLHNRSYFQDELERALEFVKRGVGGPSALLYIDLDNFKYVNDTRGHAAGDRLLMDVAQILNKRARKTDLVARFGGDEFTILLSTTGPEAALQTAESYRERLASYVFKPGGERVAIGCSVGVALISEDAASSAAEIMSQADLACHLAKRGGRNRVHLFRPGDAEKVATMTLDMGWSRRIKEAIEQSRFAIAQQPQVDTRTRQVESYEVLIRMRDTNNEIIMPGGFLASAERFGLAVDLDRWMIVHAIAALAEQRRHTPDIRYAINLSGQSLADLKLCDLVQSELERAAIPPTALTFEITETAAIADMTLAQTFLQRLRAIGCRTALDDFGSGMSSFAYLRDLPVDVVKIDGRFVKHLAHNTVDQAMVKAMNEIAHALGKKTVAEFVEDEESLTLLANFGVDYAQGYHLGRPELVWPSPTVTDRADTASPIPRSGVSG
jgi:diguanylate cyclase (GGDEF)-like protein/PAS domain S-box-containing protein